MEGRKKEHYEEGSLGGKDGCSEGRIEVSWEGKKGALQSGQGGAQASPLALLPRAADPREAQEPRTRLSQSRLRSRSGISASVQPLQGNSGRPQQKGRASAAGCRHRLRLPDRVSEPAGLGAARVQLRLRVSSQPHF